MSRPQKRQRTSAPRPISKTLLFFNDTLTASQRSQTLTTNTFPCTITGLRWELSSPIHADSGVSNSYLNWAIVLVKEGNSPNALPSGVQTVAGSLYNPEQNVLASGSGTLAPNVTGNYNTVWRGSTKTMRKMQVGDELFILYNIGATTNITDAVFGGTVQFFCKS